MAESKPNESKPSDGPASEEFVGFANAPVKDDGTHVDFRDVPSFDPERDEALYAPSSIAAFKTGDKSTDGAPMANVPGDGEDKTGTQPGEDDQPPAEEKTYAELQAEAKELGIPANQNAEALAEAIAAKRAEGEEGQGS